MTSVGQLAVVTGGDGGNGGGSGDGALAAGSSGNGVVTAGGQHTAGNIAAPVLLGTGNVQRLANDGKGSGIEDTGTFPACERREHCPPK